MVNLDPKGENPAEKAALAARLARLGRDSLALKALLDVPSAPPDTPNFEPAAVRIIERMRREMGDFQRVILKGRGRIMAPSDPGLAAAHSRLLRARDR